MNKKRNTLLDSIKFFLIFLVILGHMLESNHTKSQIIRIPLEFIYLFHMPLFVFVSGFLTKKTDFKKFLNGTIRIIEPLIIIQIIFKFPKIIDGTFDLFDLITPYWVLWYLLALIFWRTFIFLLPKNIDKSIILISALLLSLGAGFVPFIGYPLSISRTLVFFPFFLIGFYSDFSMIEKIRKIPKIISITYFLGVILFFVLLKTYITPSILYGSKSYYIFLNPIYGLIGRIFLYVGAVLSSIAFINLIPDLKFISKMGRDTLLFYIYHAFWVLAFRFLMKKLDIEPNLLLIITSTILCIITIRIFSLTNVSRIILNPYTFLTGRKL